MRCGILAAILCQFFFATESIPEELSVPKWTAADLISKDSGISLFVYSAFGMGAYPYLCSSPGTGFRVRLDGVPLRNLSPFGPDLERIPFDFIGSYRISRREINIKTPVVTTNEPETLTRFILGQKQRFRFNMTFQRLLNEKSAFFFGGSSSGIHGNDFIEANSARNYLMKYIRYLEKDASINLSIRAERDRDGIRDLENKMHMGTRTTDDIAFSLGLDEYQLWRKTVFSSILYYNHTKSRFRRYGLTKSLDDDAWGLSAKVSTQRDNTLYSLEMLHDLRILDSRIHKEYWTRSDTEVHGAMEWKNNENCLNLSGGILSSSKYGIQPKMEGELVLSVLPGCELMINGLYTGEFPDTGVEYYPALVFSDTSRVSDLDAVGFAEIETGVGISRGIVSLGFFGYISSGKKYIFTPVIASCEMSDDERYRGGRIYMSLHNENRYHFDLKLTGTSTFNKKGTQKNNRNEIWPYPELEVVSNGRLHRKFVHDRIAAMAYGKVRFGRWNSGAVTPDGNHFFLDVGLTLKVKTIEFYYKIENVTNEEMEWFNIMGWQGRNSLWGVQWKFTD
mgnify:CR=1 FL=1